MPEIGILALAQRKNGGTLPYTLSMIEALRRLPGNRYTLFTTADNSEYDDLNLPIVRLPAFPAALLGFLTTAVSGRLFHQVEKVIAPIYSTYLLASCRPFVFTLHDLQEKYYPENFWLHQRIWRQITNSLLTKRADRIICESEFVKQDIVRFFSIDGGKIEVLPAPPTLTYDLRRLTQDVLERVRLKYGLPGEFLLYPAQFWPHKNHARLIQAFARVAPAFPNCRLVLTGAKRAEYNRVFGMIRKLNIDDRVLHVGHVAQPDLPALYRLATGAVIPTLFESISIPVYEAFIIGTPVCASNIPGLSEQIGDAGLLFDPLSVEDIAGRISELLASHILRNSLVERGRLKIAPLTHEYYSSRLQMVLDSVTAR